MLTYVFSMSWIERYAPSLVCVSMMFSSSTKLDPCVGLCFVLGAWLVGVIPQNVEHVFGPANFVILDIHSMGITIINASTVSSF